MKNFFAILISVLSFSAALGQTNPLIINKFVFLPKDSLEGKSLVASLNNLLIAAEGPNEENSFVWNKEGIETFILLDEINGIAKGGKSQDNSFFKPYLTNVVRLSDTEYYTQLSYIGLEDNVPVLRASFELIAHKENNQFKFSSTLVRNSSSWKIKKIGNCVFHYKTSINEKTAASYEKAVRAFDKKLNAANQQTDIYFGEDMPELLKMIGVSYKLDYNGRAASTFSSKAANRLLIVKGDGNATFDSFDLHDLWHERLKNVVSSTIINKPVDEGCAYLYGGSWGISWKDLFKTFKLKVANDKQKNWLETYGKFDNFGESRETHLMAEYVINALIVQKIEKEKGFSSVLEFVSCGRYTKENENYFQTLEKLTGINRANFNEKVWELIDRETIQ